MLISWNLLTSETGATSPEDPDGTPGGCRKTTQTGVLGRSWKLPKLPSWRGAAAEEPALGPGQWCPQK